jgi:Zn-dependent peptidase ImmA (M78 family)
MRARVGWQMKKAQASFSSRPNSPLVQAFVARSGKDLGLSAQQIMEALVEGSRRRRDETPDERVQQFLQERKIQIVEERADLDGDGFIQPLGNRYEDGFRVRLNATSTRVRQRFTLAHEACHSLFYELVPELKFVPHAPDEQEERLCNLGAAALLIPGNALRKKVKRVQPCLDSLYELASEYTVSVQTVLLRLRSLGLWTMELSTWHRMGNGTFALDRLYGGRQVDWEWTDEEVLKLAWQRKGSTWGHTFVQYQDLRGIKRFKPVAYEVRRHSNGLIALWGKGAARQTPPVRRLF